MHQYYQLNYISCFVILPQFVYFLNLVNYKLQRLLKKKLGFSLIILFINNYNKFIYIYLGTLNPLLQDKDGRPRRNICTIIHILNDLLGASSHCNPSAQCLCSNMSSAHSKIQKSAPVKVKGKSIKYYFSLIFCFLY